MKRARTCIACGRTDDKVSLFRVVRTPAGSVEFDYGGRAAGRGAYVCNLNCFDEALRRGKLARALKITPSETESAQCREALCEALKTLKEAECLSKE